MSQTNSEETGKVNTLAGLFRKVISFLEKEVVDYLVIGGIASAALGYPRFTQDVDICILIDRNKITGFLKKLKREGFSFTEKEVVKRIRETGTFQVSWGGSHVDFLIVSTAFEKVALSRKQRITIYGIEASLPTPEDLILFKVVPSRHIDLADIENIAKRYSGKLEVKYLESWGQKLSDEAEDLRIYNEIKRLLRL